MAALLHDGAAAEIPEPLRCPVCKGTGTVVVLVAEKTWTCPAEYDDALCGTCEGSGRTGCDLCGELAVVVVHVGPLTDVLCAECAERREEGPGEPDYDGGPDYDGLMASARALDRSGW